MGRTRRGWTLGARDPVTGSGVQTTTRDIEPLTKDAVIRAQREIGTRAGIGVPGTSVIREAQLSVVTDNREVAVLARRRLHDATVRGVRAHTIFGWEFRPGSAFFFVWTQQRRDLDATGAFDLTGDSGPGSSALRPTTCCS